MAGLINDILKKRLKASTLIEVITAMVIITTVLLVSTLIYNNVLRSWRNPEKIKAQFYADQVWEMNINDVLMKKMEQQLGDMIVVSEWRPYNFIDKARVFEVTVFNQQGKLLYERKQIIYKKD